MEPCGFVRDDTLGRADSGRDGRAVKKATSARTAARPAPDGPIGARGRIGDPCDNPADARPRSRRRRRRGRRGALLLVLLACCVACGPARRRARPRAPPARPRHRRASPAPAVGQRRTGRAARTPAADLRRDRAPGRRDPRPRSRPSRSSAELIDEAELQTTSLTEQFDKDNPPEYIAANERLYKALGLIPRTATSRDLTLELLGGRRRRLLRRRRGASCTSSRSRRDRRPTEKVTYAHEFTHALQDQHFDGLQGPGRRRSTRATGPRPPGVSEGDATRPDDPLGHRAT